MARLPRDASKWMAAETVVQDLRYALRTLRRSAGFSLTAICLMAFGIGAATTVFSVVNAVLLRPLPYPHHERLAILWGDLRNRAVTDFPFAPGDFHDLREHATMFEQLAAVTSERLALSGDNNEPERVRSATVTTNLLSLLGAPFVLGRDFGEGDAVVQPEPAATTTGFSPANAVLPVSAILSYEFWQRRYGGNPDVLGRILRLGDRRAEVIGVLGPGFELLFAPGAGVDSRPEMYLAARVNYEAGSRLNVSLRVFGRLREAATIDQAQMQLDRIAADLRQRFPIKATAGYYIRAEPMHDDLVADVRPTLASLMGAVIFVVLIACANVANLHLVRLSSRAGEFAVRTALGGRPSRLIFQTLMESLVLAGAATIIALGLSLLSIRALPAFAPQNLPLIESITMDARVLAFSVASAMAATVLFGVVPALRVSRPELHAILREGGRTPGLMSGGRLRDAAAIVEVALTFILLIGAGLMIRSFVELRKADPGYDTSGVLTFAIDNIQVAAPEARALFTRQLQQRLLGLPTVDSVTAARSIPLDGETGNVRWGTEAALGDPSLFRQASSNYVLPGYFETLRTAVLDGRSFVETDDSPNSRQIVIDRVLAAQAFPVGRAVGKQLLVRSRTDEPEMLEIIGVVEHQRLFSPATDGPGTIFFVDGFANHGAAAKWMVRVNGDLALLPAQVRATLRELHPQIVVADLQPMSALVERTGAATRFALALIGTFAVIAVALAVSGLYSVLATMVRQRTSEIGVRVAFGATRRQISALVLEHGLRVTVSGVALGWVGAAALTPLMASMLVGIAPTDSLTFASVAVAFLAVAAAATYLPASRAASIDPVAALRQ